MTQQLPREYDVVMGSDKNLSTSVVLGGTRAIKQLLKTKNLECIEEALKRLPLYTLDLEIVESIVQILIGQEFLPKKEHDSFFFVKRDLKEFLAPFIPTLPLESELKFTLIKCYPIDDWVTFYPSEKDKKELLLKCLETHSLKGLKLNKALTPNPFPHGGKYSDNENKEKILKCAAVAKIILCPILFLDKAGKGRKIYSFRRPHPFPLVQGMQETISVVYTRKYLGVPWYVCQAAFRSCLTTFLPKKEEIINWGNIWDYF